MLPANSAPLSETFVVEVIFVVKFNNVVTPWHQFNADITHIENGRTLKIVVTDFFSI